MFVITYRHRGEEGVFKHPAWPRAIELATTLARRGIAFTFVHGRVAEEDGGQLIQVRERAVRREHVPSTNVRTAAAA